MEFLKILVRALGTYKSPLLFDRVVLVEMFEIGVNNTHIVWCQPVHCFTHQLRLSVIDAPVVAASLIVPSGSLGARRSVCYYSGSTSLEFVDAI